MEEFKLTEEDEYSIAIAINTVRHFLKHPLIKPLQVIGLGNALYALERMPLVTPGAFSEFGIACRTGTEAISEMRNIEFRISESEFEITRGGSVYDSSVGSDSYSEPGWLVEIDGNKEIGCDLYKLEEDISEYLNLGAVIIVRDNSDIEYEDRD
ncbi:MAG: hypothetical protein PHF24_10170 [Syntrophomonas sp.]|nr:hypothetical protein [Syntrophomonas sp.]